MSMNINRCCVPMMNQSQCPSFTFLNDLGFYVYIMSSSEKPLMWLELYCSQLSGIVIGTTTRQRLM